jgi:hypothetical protein
MKKNEMGEVKKMKTLKHTHMLHASNSYFFNELKIDYDFLS